MGRSSGYGRNPHREFTLQVTADWDNHDAYLVAPCKCKLVNAKFIQQHAAAGSSADGSISVKRVSDGYDTGIAFTAAYDAAAGDVQSEDVALTAQIILEEGDALIFDNNGSLDGTSVATAQATFERLLAK